MYEGKIPWADASCVVADDDWGLGWFGLEPRDQRSGPKIIATWKTLESGTTK